MIYTIYPNFDATIYERSQSMNTGIDAILELSHQSRGTETSSMYNSRILMKFNINKI